MRSTLGTEYREARVSPLPSEREPFTSDPALVERGLQGHADTQNELAQVLRRAGIEPRSRLPHEPNFDLAWEKGGTVFVAGVKSITDDNEEEQLRLGLGQVLRYRHRLQGLGHERVVAVLVPERTPHDPSWGELWHELGVILLAGNETERALTRRRHSLMLIGGAITPQLAALQQRCAAPNSPSRARNVRAVPTALCGAGFSSVVPSWWRRKDPPADVPSTTQAALLDDRVLFDRLRDRDVERLEIRQFSGDAF